MVWWEGGFYINTPRHGTHLRRMVSNCLYSMCHHFRILTVVRAAPLSANEAPANNWIAVLDVGSVSVQSHSHVQIFVTPWTAACQASLSITNSQTPPKPMSIASVMPSKHLILCHPLRLLPSIFPSIGFCSNESALHIRQ